MVDIVFFMIAPPNPVNNVQGPVGSHKEDIMSGEILDLAVALDDNKLREDSHRLEVNAEDPKQLQHIEPLHKYVGDDG